ncbi:DNA cytosine methyltransferase, partial [Tsukamurella ocularis]
MGNATGTNERRGGARGDEMLLPGVAVAATTGELLPTPNASDGTGGGQHPSKREGHSRQLIDYALVDAVEW